jgi:hypothetical protein
MTGVASVGPTAIGWSGEGQFGEARGVGRKVGGGGGGAEWEFELSKQGWARVSVSGFGLRAWRRMDGKRLGLGEIICLKNWGLLVTVSLSLSPPAAPAAAC